MNPYEQGYAAGENKDTCLKGLMIFGLSCCKDFESEKKTREWLKGFEAGFKESISNRSCLYEER